MSLSGEKESYKLGMRYLNFNKHFCTIYVFYDSDATGICFTINVFVRIPR